jgi:hypothetical protein
MTLSGRLEAGRWASLLWMIYPPAVAAAMGGMETSLFVFLNIISLFLIYKKIYNPLLRLLAPLAMLTRPEGLVIYLINLHDIYRNDRKRRKSLIMNLTVPVLWITFATLYFGSPIPNSILAKRTNVESTSSVSEILAGIFDGETFLLLPFFALGFYCIIKREYFLQTVVWLSAYIGLYCIATPKMWVWYYLPMQLGIILIASEGIAYVVSWLSTFRIKNEHLVRRGLIICGTVVIFFLGIYYYLPSKLGIENEEGRRYKALAVYIKNKTMKTDSILVSDIGYVGYYTNRTILDVWGLVWPSALEFPGSNSEKIPLIAQSYRPAAVVIPYKKDYVKRVMSNEWFMDNYNLDKAFTFERLNTLEIESAEVPENWSAQYLVFLHNEKTIKSIGR